ncbi:hypothetical protein XB02_19680 [Pantoea ananatis]|nr:hypothetical protein XB02_19680 [Pantoea ananatis]
MFWLKRPDIYANLPQEQLLSTAYSLLYTDDKFWSSFLDRFEKLQKRGEISEEDFLRVRWDNDLLKVVQRVSVDVGEDFSEEDIFDVVDTINRKYSEKHDAQVEALRNEHQQQLTLITDEASEKLELANRAKEDTEQQLNRLEGRVKKFSAVISKIVAWSITGLLVLALTFTGLKGIPENIQPDFLKSDFLQGSVLYIAATLTFIVGMIGSAVGKDLSFFHKKISTALEKAILKLIYGSS